VRIAVVGCGYVGLVTGCCLAEAGHDVIAIDSDIARIKMLQAKRLPFYEPGLDVVMEKATRGERLRFTSDCAEAVRASDAIFICVGTPPLESGDSDLSAIDNVARQIATAARSPKLVIEKSTVPVQTGQQLRRALEVYGCAGVSFRVASNPEFLREGSAVADFFHPERIVVGVEDQQSEQQLRDIYRPIIEGSFNCPVHESKCPGGAPVLVVTTIESSELIKHASNSFLGLKISYANFISDICDRLGANVEEVTRAMGLDPRIGPQFLNAGLGFGGFCLPKDIQAFIRLAEKHGVGAGLLREAELINKDRIEQFVGKVRNALWVVKEKKIGVLGLAFKPNTDDIRFAPAIEVIRRLLAAGAHVCASDPAAIERARAVLPRVQFCSDPYEVTRDADALLVLTDWEEYRLLDWKRVYVQMARPLVLDARNMLSVQTMKAFGFEYHSLGRPDVAAEFALASA